MHTTHNPYQPAANRRPASTTQRTAVLLAVIAAVILLSLAIMGTTSRSHALPVRAANPSHSLDAASGPPSSEDYLSIQNR